MARGSCLSNRCGVENSPNPSNNQTNNTMNGATYIDAEKFYDRQPEELFKFAYYGDEDAFKEAFRLHGITVNDYSDVEKLVSLLISGGDKKGVLIDEESGKPLIFSVEEVFGTINMREEVLDKSSVKFTNIPKK